MNAAPHKIINLLKIFFFFASVFISVCVFNVWCKTTLLLLVWLRDTERLDTPAGGSGAKVVTSHQESTSS